MSAKIHSQEGNSPDYSLRSPNFFLSDKGCKKTMTIKMQAWKQPSLKESVTAHQFRFINPKMYRD